MMLPKPSSEEIKARHMQIQNALGNQRLEGLEPDTLTNDARRWANAEISIQETIATFKDQVDSLSKRHE